MRKSAILCILFFVIAVNGFSQNTENKKYTHYIGLQANELFRQILNLSNNNSTIANPYLLVYSINNRKQWGVNMGFGWTYRATEDKLQPVNRNTKTNDFFYRVGLEKKFNLGNNFLSTVSLDFTSNYSIDRTSTISITDQGSLIDSNFVDVTTKNIVNGGGPSLKLAYRITDKILLGTETTFYYQVNKQKENVLIEQRSFNFFTTTSESSLANSNSQTDVRTFSISVPVALFLIAKF